MLPSVIPSVAIVSTMYFSKIIATLLLAGLIGFAQSVDPKESVCRSCRGIVIGVLHPGDPPRTKCYKDVACPKHPDCTTCGVPIRARTFRCPHGDKGCANSWHEPIEEDCTQEHVMDKCSKPGR
ncbi:hypothetical protein PCASD_09093 [Puccinia coronata f. sp. avenae]|uniref:Uncharacterized protein n=1 Tax=Puccinia coronata f. sp. avenae TaxID=200324 RepID=A0A2N5TDG4_9BASI|nr:hypothetical protein PCASD_09093 [Puccinia coronata f. sp. avenae]